MTHIDWNYQKLDYNDAGCEFHPIRQRSIKPAYEFTRTPGSIVVGELGTGWSMPVALRIFIVRQFRN